MKYYLAPLEGITGYRFRNAWHQIFGGMDKYFTPFISPNENRGIGPKELRDILPENNSGKKIVPQILTNNSVHFIRAAEELQNHGYNEINLNLGCPSGTVVAKNKGAGFLAKTEELDRFLFQIMEGTNTNISIKTRIGKDSAEEFEKLLPIYNQYPISELIIHPRIRTDFYRNKPNMEVFRYSVDYANSPLCYNGDIFSPKEYENFTMSFPEVGAVMLGRGIVADPGLLDHIKGGICTESKKVMAFHDLLYAEYKAMQAGEKVVLFKMKELWLYLHNLFTENEKYYKKIRKANHLADYEEAVYRMFAEEKILLPEERQRWINK